MRFPRFVLVVLGFLLIGVSVSYLHHFIYPDALSKNDLARAQLPRVELRLSAKRIGEVAPQPARPAIDGLAAHVQTEGDAKAYVDTRTTGLLEGKNLKVWSRRKLGSET